MALKWILKRSTKIPGDENIGITTTEIIVDFETGSLKEAHGFFQEEDSTITQIFGMSVLSRVEFNTEEKSTEAPAAEEAPAKRGRGPSKPKDPVVAVAPAPLPVPTATATLPPNQLAPPPPVAPSLAIPADGGIPPFLVRTAEAAAPPLPTVPSAPIAPTPPPVGVLGPKIVKALDIKKAESPDNAQLLADWLAECKLTVPGATYDEACQALLFMGDGKLAGVAERLGIAA